MKTEKEIQNEIIRYLNTLYSVGRFWETDVGKAEVRGRWISFGVVGQADISGLARGGVRVEIEVKTEKGKQSPEQKKFQKMIERFNGLYILARSVDDVRAAFLKKGLL